MTIELREPSLVEKIKRLAADQAQPAEKVLETAVQVHLDQLEREAIHAETEAFWDMHDELVEQYEGEHVALYQGEVVDHDEHASRLERRVRERFGGLPVLIAPVTPRPRRDLRWSGGLAQGSCLASRTALRVRGRKAAWYKPRRALRRLGGKPPGQTYAALKRMPPAMRE